MKITYRMQFYNLNTRQSEADATSIQKIGIKRIINFHFSVAENTGPQGD